VTASPPPQPDFAALAPPPLHYRVPEPARRSGWWTAAKWVLGLGAFFVVLLLFFLVEKVPAPVGQERFPLSDFRRELLDQNVATVVVGTGELHGTFRRGIVGPSGRAATAFGVDLPASLTENWEFTNWVLENGNGAQVSMRTNDNLLANILVPLIPWMLVFGIIWFFVFRQMRAQHRKQEEPIRVVVVGTQQA